MKKFKTKKVKQEVFQSITCDVCKTNYHRDLDFLEIQEFVSIEQNCGWDSIFGDLNTVEIDICQYCFHEKLGEFVRIKE